MKRWSALLVTGLCLIGATSPAFAKDWTVDYSHSHLGFTGTQGSATFEGEFKKFQVTIDFDPAKPETGKISATIDIASAFAGSSERDEALPQGDWFDTSHFPQAQFTTTSIKSDMCDAQPASLVIGCYRAEAILTIKGIEKHVILPFTLTKEGDHMRAQGNLTLTRTDFGIGKGEWSNDAFVKHAVDVTIDIVAH